MNADGTNKRKLADDVNGFRDYTPKFTPDASQIVFTRCQPNDGVCAIWKMRPDGTHKRALTPYVPGPNNEAIDFDVSISPDGKRIAFTRFASGGFAARVFVVCADAVHADHTPLPGGRTRRLVAERSPDRLQQQRSAQRLEPLHDQSPTGPTSTGSPRTGSRTTTPSSYSPQGNRIAFISDRNYPDACCTDLFAIHPDGSGGHMIHTGLSEAGILYPAWGTAPLLPSTDRPHPSASRPLGCPR